MNNTELVKEEVDVGVETVSVTIPVRVSMVSYDKSPFEFTASIDEVGQIILTPTSKGVEFTSANTDSNVDYDIPVAEQETVYNTNDNESVKETSIIIYATMLAENDNRTFSADVDEIGQCVIYPLDKENTFLTATTEDSLNLITEDMNVENYFGYVLINNGDGWDVKDPNGKIIEEGIATVNEAKLFVCQTEITRLKSLILKEQLETSSDKLDNENNTNDTEDKEDDKDEEETEEKPEVTAELVESLTVSELRRITEDFSDEKGIIRCDTAEELEECSNTLSEHYCSVSSCDNNGLYTVSYSRLTEDLEEDDHMSIILRFLQGDLESFTDDGEPSEDYIHIEELDTKDCSYYYDPESDSMVCYNIGENNA